jgi:flagellar biosynthesis chaperone FliJ
VPPRATTDALIRLRHADEQEAMRALKRARDVVDRAGALRDQALLAQSAVAERLAALTPAGARTAGKLGQRDAYRAQLRTELDAAGKRVEATTRGLGEANHALGEAQKQVEQALRAREAVESQRRTEDKQETRKRDRREQAASDDRWRPKKR